ncbi:transcriptional regulator with XRE-family HTH domain/predicted negative regulator of RcsB-dependent stress response [Streptacidiphilus sp. MAP12-20]|uniref:helix-turn-helix domain-containing protein n=1 Tax=Streptacidiphilus sp. MAP12-20 TaxID=3156299 RepID=UPI003519AE11
MAAAGPASMWRWATPAAQDVLATRNLGSILRHYRLQNSLTQTELGQQLGYEKTYISLLETGRRTIDDVNALRQIAGTLRLPPHTLGVTDAGDTDVAAMLQFGHSTIHLADISRQSGLASAAIDELWPLVARLEARVEDGHSEREVLELLAKARTSLGVALGHILPEERMATAARWTGKAVHLTKHLDDPSTHTTALRMHGNELRKAGLLNAAVDRLQHAVEIATTAEQRAAAIPLLARAAGECGSGELFDQAFRDAQALLDKGVAHTSLFNPYSLHEIRLRGLVATGRVQQAIKLLDGSPAPGVRVTPQWAVISHVTAGRVLLLAGDRTSSAERFCRAIEEASGHRLPHQLQRVLRDAAGLPDVRDKAAGALALLREQMAV